jgi:hypothetical protein
MPCRTEASSSFAENSAVPFFGNINNKSCAQCVYRMILTAIHPDKTWTMEQMDNLCGAVPGKYTWPYSPILGLTDMGLELVVYNTFDTERFIEMPEQYLIERYGPEGAKDQMEHSDIPAVLKQAKAFLDYDGKHKFTWVKDNHNPQIAKDLLDQGYLLGLWVNARKLNDREGISGHFIVVHGYKNGVFIAHDPGGNDEDGSPTDQFENRHIPEAELFVACCPKAPERTNIMIAIRKKTEEGK